MTFSLVVARARFSHAYIESPGDLVHWQSIPLIAGPTAGVAFALAGRDVMEGSVRGSLAGLLVGAGAGTGLGALLSRKTEWRWAGGVMGGGLGIAVGGLLGGLLAWRSPNHRSAPSTVRVGVRLPL